MRRVFSSAFASFLVLSHSLAWGQGAEPGSTAGDPIASPPAIVPSPSATRQPVDDERTGWLPLGPLPVDQAGTTGRGYQAPAESADVVEPGRNQIGLHAAAANYLYGEERAGFRIAEKYETHTSALEFRHGFSRLGVLPRFELGGQLQVHRNTDGFLNGFISRVESLVARTTGHQAAVNELRTGLSRAWPLINLVERDGQDLYRREGPGSGFGDVLVFVKTVLKEGTPSASAAKMAARVVLNVSGSEAFTAGNYVSTGLSASKRVLGWLALHGDARVNLAIDHDGRPGLPLKRGSAGATGGIEFKLSQKTALSIQVDANSTPYETTGTRAFDRPYGAVDLGISRLWGSRLVTHFYGRENMNLKPIQLQPNLDPDFSIGIKVTIRTGSQTTSAISEAGR